MTRSFSWLFICRIKLRQLVLLVVRLEIPAVKHTRSGRRTASSVVRGSLRTTRRKGRSCHHATSGLYVHSIQLCNVMNDNAALRNCWHAHNKFDNILTITVSWVEKVLFPGEDFVWGSVWTLVLKMPKFEIFEKIFYIVDVAELLNVLIASDACEMFVFLLYYFGKRDIKWLFQRNNFCSISRLGQRVNVEISNLVGMLSIPSASLRITNHPG